MIEVKPSPTLAQAMEFPTILDVGLYLLAGLGVVFVLGVVFMRIPDQHNSRVVILVLIVLILMGLALRLWIVSTTDRLLNTPAQLIGDESRYDNVAYALRQGEFFQWPGVTPIYPLFLAGVYLIFGHSYAVALYLQAFVGATTIPLTYRVARRFIGRRSSLLAAMLVALHPNLIGQTAILYTEVLYTSLLLLALLGLLWALEAPFLRRFILAGVLLGIANLVRPATALLPLFLPLILLRVWSLRRRVTLWVVYSVAMVAVIIPWTYHNYRTHNTFLPFSLTMAQVWTASPEFYHLMKQKPNAIVRIWDEELNPERNGGHNPLTIEGDRYFTARGIASIRAEPGIYAWYSLQKLAFFWIGHPAADYDWPFNFALLRKQLSAGWIAAMFGFRLLLVVATLAGLIILRRRLRVFTPLLLICGYLMLVYALLLPVARYSEPLYPILAVIIAAAVSELIDRYHAHLRSFGVPLDARQLTYLRDLLRELVVRDMKLRYKRSILGVAWSLLNPLMQMLVFVFLFRRVLPLDIPNYPSFVFTGVLAWSWFQAALSLATGAITDNRELIRRPGFPTAILPVVTVTTNLIHFLLALPIPLLFIVIGGGRLTGAIVTLPLVIAVQFLLILGLGYLVATVHVTFRDTQHLLGVFLMLLFYLTPVFYDASIIPEHYQPFYRLNPMFHLITAYREILIQGNLPDLRTLLALAAIVGGLLWLGHRVFTRASYRFVEEL